MKDLTVSNGKWINNVSKRLKKEIDIIRKEVSIVRSTSSESVKINGLIKLAYESEGYTKQYFEYQKEWIIEQITDNHLPETSSGSFISALLDIDTIIVYFDIEENEELKKYVYQEIKSIRNNK